MKNTASKMNINLSEKIYRNIYQKITSLKYLPGEKITETMLAESFGVSRAPVREALKRLSEDHLVVLIPRTGCRIAKPHIDEIREIYDIRVRLEDMALNRAFHALVNIKTNLERLKLLRTQFVNCTELPPEEFVLQEIKLDTQLHNIIYQNSQCPNLQEMLEKLRARMEIFRIREANYIKQAQDAQKEHIGLLDAIIDNNKKIALSLLEKHIQNTKQKVLKTCLSSA